MSIVGPVADTDLTPADLRELADSWAVRLRATGRTRETIRVYLRNVTQYLAFCERAGLPPIKRGTMDAFIADLLDGGREGSTARGRLTAVKQFGKWLLEVEEIEADPFAAVPTTPDGLMDEHAARESAARLREVRPLATILAGQVAFSR